jgi:hypothetical protein
LTPWAPCEWKPSSTTLSAILSTLEATPPDRACTVAVVAQASGAPARETNPIALAVSSTTWKLTTHSGASRRKPRGHDTFMLTHHEPRSSLLCQCVAPCLWTHCAFAPSSPMSLQKHLLSLLACQLCSYTRSPNPRGLA